jgi:hypothetical protein
MTTASEFVVVVHATRLFPFEDQTQKTAFEQRYANRSSLAVKKFVWTQRPAPKPDQKSDNKVHLVAGILP